MRRDAHINLIRRPQEPIPSVFTDSGCSNFLEQYSGKPSKPLPTRHTGEKDRVLGLAMLPNEPEDESRSIPSRILSTFRHHVPKELFTIVAVETSPWVYWLENEEGTAGLFNVSSRSDQEKTALPEMAFAHAGPTPGIRNATSRLDGISEYLPKLSVPFLSLNSSEQLDKSLFLANVSGRSGQEKTALPDMAFSQAVPAAGIRKVTNRLEGIKGLRAFGELAQPSGSAADLSNERLWLSLVKEVQTEPERRNEAWISELADVLTQRAIHGMIPGELAVRIFRSILTGSVGHDHEAAGATLASQAVAIKGWMRLRRGHPIQWLLHALAMFYEKALSPILRDVLRTWDGFLKDGNVDGALALSLTGSPLIRVAPSTKGIGDVARRMEKTIDLAARSDRPDVRRGVMDALAAAYVSNFDRDVSAIRKIALKHPALVQEIPSARQFLG